MSSRIKGQVKKPGVLQDTCCSVKRVSSEGDSEGVRLVSG